MERNVRPRGRESSAVATFQWRPVSSRSPVKGGMVRRGLRIESVFESSTSTPKCSSPRFTTAGNSDSKSRKSQHSELSNEPEEKTSVSTDGITSAVGYPSKVIGFQPWKKIVNLRRLVHCRRSSQRLYSCDRWILRWMIWIRASAGGKGDLKIPCLWGATSQNRRRRMRVRSGREARERGER
jgi:hypothetical protein